VLEFEQLIKINYGDAGTRDGVLANLEATLAWVREQNAGNLEAARLSRAGHGLPQRAALNHLTGRFLTDHYLTVARWAQWASELVRDWPEDVSKAVIDPATADEGYGWRSSSTKSQARCRRAEQRARQLDPGPGPRRLRPARHRS
jgi:hypothetical protein